MLSSRAEVVSWTPETDSDRERVQQELSSILSGPHFRNSKRYPALLRYLVEKTLDGEVSSLKERTLGVEVFDRRHDYDTNADPVVRFSASEVRKRLAQHYHEAQLDHDIQIELPLGSYVPEFRLRIDATEPSDQVRFDPAPDHLSAPLRSLTVPAAVSEVTAVPRKVVPRYLALILGGACALFIGLCGAWYLRKAFYPDLTKVFWSTLLATPGPTMIVVGTGNLELTAPEPPQTSLYDHMIGPYHHVSLSSAVAISRLTNILQSNNAGYVVKEAPETSLTDLRGRSVVLVGALNNIWSLRLVTSLRYQLVQGPMAAIVDRESPGKTRWTVDFSKPFASASTDYAIVARYHDDSTNGNVVIVAGLGPYGTEAASEFVTSPQYLKKALNGLPKDWKNRNIELVIKTDVIGGQAGPPYLVASTVW